MNAGLRDLPKTLIYLIIVFLAPIGIYSFSKYIINVEKSLYEVSLFSDSDSDNVERSLPFSNFAYQKKNRATIRGHFSVPLGGMGDAVYIYIPFYVGQLKLTVGGDAVYTSDPDAKERPVNFVANVFERIPENILDAATDDKAHSKVYFQIEQDLNGLVSVGKVYFGSRDDFRIPDLIHTLYYVTLRAVTLGGHLAIMCLFLVAIVTRGVGSEYIPALLILLYYISFNAGALSAIVAGTSAISQLNVALGPAATVCILYTFFLVFYENQIRKRVRIFISFLFVSVLPLLLVVFGAVGIQNYNLFFAAPFLLLGIVILSSVSIVLLLKTGRKEMGLWAVASTLMASSLVYDFSARVGRLDVVVFTTALTSPAFIVLLSVMFVKIILSTKRTLEKTNYVLEAALERQNQELLVQFDKSAKLLRETSAAHEKARLTAELHDGVLTYLAMMTDLAENGSDSSLKDIHKLGRYASNEIRIILEARPSDRHSVTIALGALRRQMIDPLNKLGIDVEWSTEALLDYGTIDPKSLMNVIRILQEAIYNAVFRSYCTHISIVAGLQDGEYVISIVNKGGRAFSDEYQKGLGIVSMTDRASIIGGRFVIRPCETGAIATLFMPPK